MDQIKVVAFVSQGGSSCLKAINHLKGTGGVFTLQAEDLRSVTLPFPNSPETTVMLLDGLLLGGEFEPDLTRIRETVASRVIVIGDLPASLQQRLRVAGVFYLLSIPDEQGLLGPALTSAIHDIKRKSLDIGM